MHSGDLGEIEKSDLSEQEKEALLQVMQRAKQFDQQTLNSSASGPLEGQLQKWTNPLKGWQPRWFCVDKLQAVLHYYTSEDKRKQPPRGSLHLFGAVVSPSEEDSQSFSISGASGEIYKLRAVDAKQRQFWVSRLRREVENCTNQFGSLSNTPVGSPVTTPSKTTHNGGGPSDHHLGGSHLSSPHGRLSKRFHALKLKHTKPDSSSAVGSTTSIKSTTDSASSPQSADLEREEFPGGDAMLEVLTRLQSYQESMQMQLESYGKQTGLDPFNKDVLLLKATSQAAVHSVRDCLALMKLQQQREQATVAESDHPKSHKESGAVGSAESSPSTRPRSMAGVEINMNAAAMDASDVGDGWRERSSSDGKMLRKSTS